MILMKNLEYEEILETLKFILSGLPIDPNLSLED